MSKQTRRAFLATAGLVGIAGCNSVIGDPGTDGNGSNGTQTTQPPTSTPTPTPTQTPVGKLAGLPGEQVESFEDLERWFPIADQGTLEATTNDPYSGSQSATVTSSSGDAFGSLFKAFSEPQDFSGKNLSLAVKVTKPQIAKVGIDLLAPDRGNKVRMMRTLTGPTNRWMRIDFGATSIDRNPDLSEVREIRIHCRHRGGANEPVEFAVDDLRAVESTSKGAVMLTFDDSHITHYEEAFPRMQEYGFPGVEGVIAATIYNNGRLDVGQMREMSSAGWDMASHPVTRGKQLPEFSPEEQERRIVENKQFLDRKGFREGARHFLTPQNMRGPNTFDLAKKHHETMFSFGGSPNGLPSTTMHNYGRLNAEGVQTVRRLIDYAEEFGQLVAINHHIIGGDGLSTEVFESHLEYIDDADVEVVTASDLLDRYGLTDD